MFVAALVIVVCPAIRTPTTAPAPTLSRVTATLVAADPVQALTARLIDQRTGPALPRPSDLAAIDSTQDLASPSPDIFGEPRDTADDPNTDRSVTGDAVAFRAPNAGGLSGIGAATLSGAGSSGATSAVISGRDGLATHAGFTVGRHTTATGTIHTSVRPLGRPG